MVFIDGEFSHALREPCCARTRSRPFATTPSAPRAMYDPNLVHAGSATASEVRFAEAVIDEIRRRFGAPLYAGRRHLRAGRPCPARARSDRAELYFDEAPGVAERLADAILARGRSAADRSAWPCGIRRVDHIKP